MEGPSVHQAADEISVLEGQEIISVSGNAKQPIDRLESQSVNEVRAVRKRLFIELDSDTVVIHFLMYGTYRVDEERDRDERLRLEAESDTVNIYNGSVKVYHNEDEELEELDRPDRDVISEEFDREAGLEFLEQSDRTVAEDLLDQDYFGGVGNIVKNEVLFITGIDPRSTSSEIPEEKLRELIDQAVDWTRSWYDHKKSGESKEQKVYMKGECPECGSDLHREHIGEEHERVTMWCGDCQDRY